MKENEIKKFRRNNCINLNYVIAFKFIVLLIKSFYLQFNMDGQMY